MLITMAVTALSALVYFARTPGLPRRGVLVAVSALSTALFAVLLVLTVQQIDYLTGLGPVVNTLLLLLPPLGAFLAGLVVTLRRRDAAMAGRAGTRAPVAIE